ncbi:MAG: D-aminoacyl-tRNA deacylase [Ignavibacteria bacterium]|nr:D-aminoacyl-tRNA deacylase [Ignavibacteria bacterium]
MIIVVQRVEKASVEINGEVYSRIGKGLLVFLGIEKGDSEKELDYLSKKIIDLRIFNDENDKMNLCVRDVGGDVLIISQFTLCTDDQKSGNRPSFFNAEVGEQAEYLYKKFIEKTKCYYEDDRVKSGIFAAMMKIELINDGPVTIILRKKYNENK